MKLTKNIDLRELVPSKFYSTHGARSIRFLNAQLILATQWLIDRHNLDSAIFNNWHYAKPGETIFTQRGLRTPESPLFRIDGTHDNGNGIDFEPRRKGTALKDLIREIHIDATQNPKLYFEQGIWRMEVIELAETWIHLDACFSPGQNELVFIDLSKRYTAQEYLKTLTP